MAAVVGGNVLTSQRVVDVVLGAFEVCAASQGCMNNITFGEEGWGYYETVAGGAGAVSLLEERLYFPPGIQSFVATKWSGSEKHNFLSNIVHLRAPAYGWIGNHLVCAELTVVYPTNDRRSPCFGYDKVIRL